MRKPGYVSRVVQNCPGADPDEVRTHLEVLLGEIEVDLRRGKEVHLKHFGRFVPSSDGGIRFEPHPRLLNPLGVGDPPPPPTEAAF